MEQLNKKITNMERLTQAMIIVEEAARESECDISIAVTRFSTGRWECSVSITDLEGRNE